MRDFLVGRFKDVWDNYQEKVNQSLDQSERETKVAVYSSLGGALHPMVFGVPEQAHLRCVGAGPRQLLPRPFLGGKTVTPVVDGSTHPPSGTTGAGERLVRRAGY